MQNAWEQNLGSAITDLWKIDRMVADFLGATQVDPQTIETPPLVLECLRARHLQPTTNDPGTLRLLRLLCNNAINLLHEVIDDTKTAAAIASLAHARPEQFDNLNTALAAIQGTGPAPLTMLAWQTRALLIATQPVRTPEAAVHTTYVVARWTYAHFCHRMLAGEDKSHIATAVMADHLRLSY